MRTTGKRLTALLLSVLLAVLGCVVPVCAETADNAHEEYRERVFQRYDTYRTGAQVQYETLCNEYDYMHANFAMAVEDFGALRKSIVWATDKLTGHQADRNTYIDYLTRILAMHEKSYMDTVSAQAVDRLQKDKLGDMVSTATLTISMVVGTDWIQRANTGLSMLGTGLDLLNVGRRNVLNTAEAFLYTLLSENYQNSVLLLEAIRDNAQDENLKSAAQTLLDTVDLQFAYLLLDLDVGSMAKNLQTGADFVLNANNLPDTGFFFETIGRSLNRFSNWIVEKSTATGLAKYLAAAGSGVLKAAGYVAFYYTAFAVGTSVGGAVGNWIWGDDLDCYLEMRIMTEVGRALSTAVLHYRDAEQGLSGDERLTMIRRIVSSGEGLAIARLRGETCYIESKRNNRFFSKVTEDEESLYKIHAENAMNCFYALDRIFPDEERQVVVVSIPQERTVTHGGKEIFSASVAKPVLYIPSDPDTAEVFNTSKVLQDLYAAYDTYSQDVEAVAYKYPPVYGSYFYTAKLLDAYAVPNAISLQFMESEYTGGAHPNSARYSITVDLTSGQRLLFDDLPDPAKPNAMAELEDLFVQALLQELPDLNNPRSAVRTVMNEEAPHNWWRFTPEGLTMTFSPYVIAAYAVGYVEATVPYNVLQHYLREEYVTESRSASAAQGILLVADEACDPEQMVVYGEPDTLGLCCLEKTFNMKIGTLSYDDVLQEVFFYTNVALGNELIWMPPVSEYTTYAARYQTYGPQDLDPTNTLVQITKENGVYTCEYTDIPG